MWPNFGETNTAITAVAHAVLNTDATIVKFSLALAEVTVLGVSATRSAAVTIDTEPNITFSRLACIIGRARSSSTALFLASVTYIEPLRAEFVAWAAGSGVNLWAFGAEASYTEPRFAYIVG